jgi:hypothetical protein
MRLLKLTDRGEFSLTKDLINDIPPYAILSHTWGDNEEEITYKDVMEGLGREKVGYKKIQFCAAQTARDGLQYFWVDTCCIDKSNHVEFSEAIISMFRWYQNSVACYVYLTDVSITSQKPAEQCRELWEQSFLTSRWFIRGWTLQELIAPQVVKFFSIEGNVLGDKKSLENQVHAVTKIPVRALRGYALSTFTIQERLAWARSRKTQREEDETYCLLGMFDVHMPLLYGERKENARNRLLQELNKRAPSVPQGECSNADTNSTRSIT